MYNVWELSNDRLIDRLAMLEVDFSKFNDKPIPHDNLEYKEIKNELQKRLHFGIDYREKYELLGYAEFVTKEYFDYTLEEISEEAHEIYYGFAEYEYLEDLEDIYSYSDTITDGKRVAFLEW